MFALKLCLITSAASILVDTVSGFENYPDLKINPKPCARKKNTINYQGPICVENAAGGFTFVSEENCRGALRATCPEFNKGSCQWLDVVGFPTDADPAKRIPCCKLEYSARGYTWMEVYYTLQYGSNGAVYDIVEVQRHINKEGAFGARNTDSWPWSVMDSAGERGLTWTVATNLKKPLSLPGASAETFCAELQDSHCSGDVVKYLSENYPTGFNDSLLPKMSTKESEVKVTPAYVLKPNCFGISVNGTWTAACQVLYVRQVNYQRVTGVTRSFKTAFEYLEAQVYFVGKDVALRYAYWAQEDPETRDEIFSLDPLAP